VRVATVTDDRILLVVDGYWAGEGWHGRTRAAQLIEAKALCPKHAVTATSNP
jgi:hypothetical protein